ncbi:MAG: M4 family metallopeptidase, partial [Anaerolineae bacterium]
MKTHSVILTVVLTLVFVLSPYPRNFVAPGAPPVAWADDGTVEPGLPVPEAPPPDRPQWPGYVQAPASLDPLLVEQLQRQTDGTVRLDIHPQTGYLRFIGTDPAHFLTAAPDGQVIVEPVAAALTFLQQYGTLFGLSDPAQELHVRHVRTSETGRSFVRFQQVHAGIPILAGEIIVELDAESHVYSVSGEILPGPAVSLEPAISADAARAKAFGILGKEYGLPTDTFVTITPTLWIYNPMLMAPGNGMTSLVWQLEVTTHDLAPIRELVLVDAQRGIVLLHFNQVDTARNRLTYTTNHSSTLPGTLVCNESNPTCSGGDTHAVGAHVYAGHTYDFYTSYHGRDSINGAGMSLISSVHYCPPTGQGACPYNNAFWNGSQMVYGDAVGYALADDVVAHELTHGVTQYESGLFYYYQSGAINESFSDLWGEFVDLTNGAGNDTAPVRWLLGEDIGGGGAIRNMQNPPAFQDPDKMTSVYYYTGTGDNGGVHYNSGVNNKAVFLMTDGGSFNGRTVTALGITKVAKIYYDVQTNRLASGGDYGDLYNLLYQACLSLVGTAGITPADCQEVRDATDAVEMNLEPVSGYNTDAALCPQAGQVPNTTYFDDFEGALTNWITNNASIWTVPVGNAHSPIHSAWGYDPNVILDTYLAMASGVSLPPNAYLHFAHAYFFEGANYDGGVLEYSINGGSTWTDAGSFIQVNGYDGAIGTGYGNPLGGRQAFLADSHGYISSRLTLASLAGQSIRFRWRIGSDNAYDDWGWFIDDVRIYTCVNATPSATPTPTSTRTPTI